jgi:hypothetical protein
MQSDTHFKIANQDDIEGIVKLQKDIYPDYKRDIPFFVWQCFENINPSVLIVAQQKTTIVGTLGIQRIKTNNNLNGGQLSWIIVANHQRRRGLFAKMSSLALEYSPDLDFIFIFANREVVPPCEKRLGMKFIGNLHQLILKPNSIMYVDAHLEPITIHTRFPCLPGSKEYITFSRTEPYRHWRYVKNTVYEYFKVSISSTEYAILKLFNNQGSAERIGDIVDVECNILDRERTKALHLAASFELMKMGVTFVTTWAAPGSRLRYFLEEVGFKESDHFSSFGIKIFKESNNNLYDLKAWHLVQSDASNY